jgi:hypothetical protein
VGNIVYMQVCFFNGGEKFGAFCGVSQHKEHLGTCENAAENGGFGGCFQQPFHQSLTRAPGRFNPFLGFSRQAFQGLEPPAGLPTFSPSFLTTPPHFFRGPYFGSSNSLSKMGFSTICGSWLAVYMDRVPNQSLTLASLIILPSSFSLVGLPLRPPSLSSALSHECTTTANPPCTPSSTLDRPCVPRRDISETGEISKGWLATAEP